MVWHHQPPLLSDRRPHVQHLDGSEFVRLSSTPLGLAPARAAATAASASPSSSSPERPPGCEPPRAIQPGCGSAEPYRSHHGTIGAAVTRQNIDARFATLRRPAGVFLPRRVRR
jgi:hypothetical protein